MDAITYVAGIREFADWIEQNGELLEDEGRLTTAGLTFYLAAHDKKELAQFAKMLGRATKEIDSTGDFALKRKCGPVTIHVYAQREKVCERVVTGTKTKTQLVHDPALLEQVPMVEVTEEVEEVEWVCPPSLLALAEEAVA